MDHVPGFETSFENDNDSSRIKKNKKGSSGFQSMNLSFNILKGILKRGYKQPTPIQRKAIPLILEGRDVVAMARTGSGKTACFLIPLFEKLKLRSAKSGARAIIFSPTRELALQTRKFLKEIGRYVDLKTAVILGGDSMDDQFAAIHGNPDVLIATPGRFLHLCVEMELKLKSIEYVVFDEADRLFEMGLNEQMLEIISRLPDSRQTVMFSATLPKVLVEFAKAGLNDPVLIRLDVESKIPEQLKLHYFIMQSQDKLAGLLFLLKNFINADQQTVVFVATKHHVDYIHSILDRLGVSNTYIYSNLDPSARKIHSAKFSSGKVKVLIVTDVAARGIDIPQLDNVINFNFPGKPKLFVHRVGRCARAGRSGIAYSLVAPDEFAHLLDLHNFLGRPLSIASSNKKKDACIGRIPQSIIEDHYSNLIVLHENNAELENLKTVSENSYKKYIKSRQASSTDSNKKAKELQLSQCFVHPLFDEDKNSPENERNCFLSKMQSYRPQGTIFEICGKNKSQEYLAMKEKRLLHRNTISNYRAERLTENEFSDTLEKPKLTTSSSDDINSTFKTILLPKKRKIDDLYKKSNKKQRKDENFIPYAPADKHTEEGLAINNFQTEASKVQLDIVGDSEETLKSSKQLKKWDRKKKKMVAVADVRQGKIKTESGRWISATYKTDRYKNWMEKSKTGATDDNSDDESAHVQKDIKPKSRWAQHNEKLKMKQRKSEMKTTNQILKSRNLAEKKKQRQKKKSKSKRKKTRQ